jgi:quinohemoprotein ethanol dehydrogenase
VSQKQAWRVTHDHPVSGGVLSTAGGLVFQGHGGGVFAAYAAESGERLWHSDIGIGVMAPPVTYAVKGEQYIAVLAGIGGTPALNHVELDYVNDGRILVYKLDGKASLPPVVERPAGIVDAPPLTVSPAALARGDSLFSTHCGRCHGFLARGTGFLPDLRHSPRAVHDAWDEIVLKGAFHAQGMASFADLIDSEDSRAIHGYVVSQALREPTLVDHLVGWAREHLCVPTSWVAD